MAKVTLTGVSKTYKARKAHDVAAVQNLNLAVKDREFVVLVGPSGCGKTTTLRMIAGLEEISAGEIFIGDKGVNQVPPKDRDIAMVFQNPALYPHLTVFQNLAFGLELKFPKTEIKRRVQEAAAILDIESFLERKPKALSGGQRQRVAVGRAMVRQPKVFLFDEPLSNLDIPMRAQMRTEIIKLHHRLQATMIYVTHDQSEAMTMGDRIVVMRDGVAQQIDEPLKIYHEPANLFVAGFMGSPPMNLIRGRLREMPNGFVFKETGEGVIECELFGRPEAKSFIGKEVVLGIRPENIVLPNEEKPTQTKTFLKGLVEVVESLGAETNVYLQTGAHTVICRSGKTIDHSEVGRRMRFEIETSKAHLFDPETTRRIV